MYSMIYTMIIASAVIMAIVLYLMMKVMLDRSAESIALFKTFGYRKREISRLLLSCMLIYGIMHAFLVKRIREIPAGEILKNRE